MTELPLNWIELSFEKILELINGFAFKSSEYVEQGIRVVRITNVQKGYFTDDNPKYYKHLDKLSKYQLKNNDILMSLTGNVGRVCLLENKYLPAYLNQRVACIRIKNENFVNTKFIFYTLNSDHFENMCIQNSKGNAQLNLSTEFVKTITLKIPPLNEQKRIVKKLDTIMPKVDEINSRLERIPIILKRARQSILNQAITGELTKEWRKKNNKKLTLSTFKLSEICDLLNGYAYKSNSYVTDTNNLIIRLGNVKNDKILLETKPVFIPNEVASETKNFVILENDILVTLTGTRYKRDYLYSAIVTADDLSVYKLFLNQRVGCFRTKAICLPQFLNILLKSQNFLDQAFALETGNVNQGNIGTTSLKDIEIEIPTLEEQEEIVKQVKKAFEKLDKIEESYKKTKQYTDKVTQSILHKAFTGNLVPQDPNDKPVKI